MKNKLDSFKILFRKHKVLFGIFALLVLGAFVATFFGRDSQSDTLTIVAKEFTREIEIAGKVVAAKDVSLSFETSGRVANVYKNVNEYVGAGETIAVLSSADLYADQLKAQADLDAEIAKLDELKSGVAGTDTETLNAKRSLVEELLNAYGEADDAIHNNVDQFYDDPLTRTPEIVFAFNDYTLKKKLDRDRVVIEELLTSWEEDRSNITISSVSSKDIEATKDNLRKIQVFLDDVAKAVNTFEAETGLTQAQIDKYKADVAQARSNINASVNSIIAAQEKFRGVEAQLPFQEAKVKAARANVLSYSAQIAKTVIRAPFSGIIAKQDAKVGEYASSNDPVVTILSSNNFQIETFVPEINIKEIQIGNLAKVTLDAFDETDFFDTKVISIDPAETIRDGVSTYKVVFEFVNNDNRLKSGMTANVDITTEKRSDVIAVPQSTVTKRNGGSYVQVKVENEIVEKLVITGDVASSGEVEVISGLNVGEMVVLEPIPFN